MWYVVVIYFNIIIGNMQVDTYVAFRENQCFNGDKYKAKENQSRAANYPLFIQNSVTVLLLAGIHILGTSDE